MTRQRTYKNKPCQECGKTIETKRVRQWRPAGSAGTGVSCTYFLCVPCIQRYQGKNP